MRDSFKAVACGAALAILVTGTGRAAEEAYGSESAEERIETLERKVRILTEEVQDLRRDRPMALSGGGIAPREAGEAYAFGRSASQVYRQSESGVSWAGYGEAHVRLTSERPDVDPGGGDRSSFFRQALYLGYRFSDRFLVNSELEIEHSHDIASEFAYLDFLYSERVRFRAGLLLVPLGLLNQQHEPTDYWGNHRPLLTKVLIPTTMRENGAGAYGTLASQWQYHLYVMNSLDGKGLSPEGLAGARQNGWSGDGGARTEDAAVIGRLDWAPLVGVRVGVSAWHGDTGQRQLFAGGRPDVPLTLADVHARWDRGPWRLQGVYAEARIGDTLAVNRDLGIQPGDTGAVPERMTGWYLEAGYDVLSAWSGAERQALYPWVRYSRVNTQAELADDVEDAGLRTDPALDRRVRSYGLHYLPHPSIVLKAEHRNWSSADSGPGTNNHREFRAGFGYRF